jgi:hypothetical protein
VLGWADALSGAAGAWIVAAGAAVAALMLSLLWRHPQE